MERALEVIMLILFSLVPVAAIGLYIFCGMSLFWSILLASLMAVVMFYAIIGVISDMMEL